MSYTVTISGSAQPTEGQSQEQADEAVKAKAQAFAKTLPGVSAAFIQTLTGGMADLNPPAPPPAEPTQDTTEEAATSGG